MRSREYLHQRLLSCQEWSCLVELTIVMFWQHCNISHTYSGMYFTPDAFPPVMFHSTKLFFSVCLELLQTLAKKRQTCCTYESLLPTWHSVIMRIQRMASESTGFCLNIVYERDVRIYREERCKIKSELETRTAQTQADGGNTVSVTSWFRVCCEGSRYKWLLYSS